MKKVLMLLVFLTSIFLLSGCDETVSYDVQTKYLYSNDGTEGTYREGVQEFYVNTRIYLVIEITYSASTKNEVSLEFDINIPHAEHYDAFYFDGQKIDPSYDSVAKILTYTPTLIFSKEPKTTKLVFQITPTQEGIARITVEFPDVVDASMNSQDTVQFVLA